jgi:hypothetical protein
VAIKELVFSSTVAKFATVQNENGRLVERQIDYYNLDVIISVGYRVKSQRGTEFRIWATKTLKEYLLIDADVLTLLSNRKKGVTATIYTAAISAQFQLDLNKHNAQYPPIVIQKKKNIHDRFLLIDNDIYHIGASLKDLGRKLFAFSKMTSPASELLKNIPSGLFPC